MDKKLSLILITKFTNEQHTTINQSPAGCFNPRVFVMNLDRGLHLPSVWNPVFDLT